MTAIDGDRETILDHTVGVIVDGLASAGFFSRSPGAGWAASYHELRRAVRSGFQVDRTSITTVMSRLLFAIGAAHKPRTILGLGTYQGNALVWLAGHALSDTTNASQPISIVGCDIDGDAVNRCRRNFDSLQQGSNVVLLHADAFDVIERHRGLIDLLYIDVDSSDTGKRSYGPLVELARPKLRPRALVVAHDASLPRFSEDLAPYFAVVEDRSRFSKTIRLPVDSCGIELTLV